MATPTQSTERPAQAARSAARPGPTAFAVWALFIVGCVLLVVAVLIMDDLPGWASDHGQLQILLPYFLLVSLAGRWFWKGIDTALTNARNRTQR